MKKQLLGAGTVVVLLVLTGCATLFGRPTVRHERTSSLVDYLYQGGVPPVQNAVPVLHLPLTVGVAFLPGPPGRPGALDEASKVAILEAIRARFQTRGFVREIITIPDYYLASQRGFEGLAALQRLYNLDLVALVSYDQVARQDANELSLAYLTIVGSWLVPGTSQDVNTMVDLAVVHPATRSLVLRAAGMDSRTGVSTDIGASGRLRERSVASFQASAARMIDNFDAELLQFEQRVKQGTARVQVVSPGAGGGGAVGSLPVAALLCLVLGSAAVRIRRPRAAPADRP